MADQYLLPCECGAVTPIDASQAGGSVLCQCGQELEVPSLRAIRELDPVHDEVSVRKDEWNPVAGMIFVSGMFVALMAAAIGIYLHMVSVQLADFDGPPEADVAAWIASVDDAPPEELFDIWNASRHIGLGDYRMSPFVQRRLAAQRYAMYRNASLIVMVSGLAFAATSILVRRKPIR